MRKTTAVGGAAAIAAAGALLFSQMQTSEPTNVVKLRIRMTVPTLADPVDSMILRAGLNYPAGQHKMRRYAAGAGGTQLLDSFYFQRPSEGDSLRGYACGATKRRLLESEGSCKPWKYHEPTSDTIITEIVLRLSRDTVWIDSLGGAVADSGSGQLCPMFEMDNRTLVLRTKDAAKDVCRVIYETYPAEQRVVTDLQQMVADRQCVDYTVIDSAGVVRPDALEIAPDCPEPTEPSLT